MNTPRLVFRAWLAAVLLLVAMLVPHHHHDGGGICVSLVDCTEHAEHSSDSSHTRHHGLPVGHHCVLTQATVKAAPSKWCDDSTMYLDLPIGLASDIHQMLVEQGRVERIWDGVPFLSVCPMDKHPHRRGPPLFSFV